MSGKWKYYFDVLWAERAVGEKVGVVFSYVLSFYTLTKGTTKEKNNVLFMIISIWSTHWYIHDSICESGGG